MDRQAFEQLALGEMDAVFRVALRLTRNRERAEDLVQDVYARALRPSAVESFRLPASGNERGGMRAWLMAITHNTYYSKGQREAPADARGRARDDGVPAREGHRRRVHWSLATTKGGDPVRVNQGWSRRKSSKGSTDVRSFTR